MIFCFFLFNDPATTEIYTLSLHDALPIFEPSRKTNNLSVSQITDLKSSGDERSIWFIGKVVEKERNARGDPVIMASRADISVSVILDLKLDVIPDIPPPRHANITNFPPVDPEESYTKLQIQQKLADKAEGFLDKEVKDRKSVV